MIYRKYFVLLIFLILCSERSPAQDIMDCARCDRQLLTHQDIDSLSYDELNLLKNEIFARHGYMFEKRNYDEHFSNQTWYQRGKDNSSIKLNKTEEANIAFIKRRMDDILKDREALVTQLKRFKTAVLQKDKVTLLKEFNFDLSTTNPEYENAEFSPQLESILSRIDLNDIHYYKHKGIHSVLVDNGLLQRRYSLNIDGSQVWLLHADESMSEIIEGFTAYTEYASEEIEYAIFWLFDWNNDKLTFIRTVVAG